MAYSLPLEQAYLAKEFRRDPPSSLRVVGTLLDSAFAAGGQPDRELDHLLAHLQDRPAR